MEQAKILVVDDEAFVRRTISRVLSSEGMSIAEAANGHRQFVPSRNSTLIW